MKRLMGWVVAVAVLAAILAPRDGAADPRLFFSVPFDSNSTLVSTGVHIADENDTTGNATAVVDLRGVDWEKFYGGLIFDGSGGTLPVAIGLVEFVVSGISTATDTLYVITEICSNMAATTPTCNRALLQAYPAVNNYTAAVNPGQLNGGKIFQAYLYADPDATRKGTIGTPNLWQAEAFRIRVIGDQSGSSPVVTGVKCRMSLPVKTIPAMKRGSY